MNYLRKTFRKRSFESFAHVLTLAKSIYYSNEQVIRLDTGCRSLPFSLRTSKAKAIRNVSRSLLLVVAAEAACEQTHLTVLVLLSTKFFPRYEAEVSLLACVGRGCPRYLVLLALEVLVSVCFCAQEPVGVPLVERMLRSLLSLVPRVFWLFGPFGYEIVVSLA